MLSPFAIPLRTALSAAKGLRVNFAKHPRIALKGNERDPSLLSSLTSSAMSSARCHLFFSSMNLFPLWARGARRRGLGHAPVSFRFAEHPGAGGPPPPRLSALSTSNLLAEALSPHPGRPPHPIVRHGETQPSPGIPAREPRRTNSASSMGSRHRVESRTACWRATATRAFTCASCPRPVPGSIWSNAGFET